MSWPVVKLGDLVEIKGGGTPSKNEGSFWGGDIPWASVKDLKGSRISKTEDSISELGVKNSATNVIPAGTIITATRMALGRFAISTVDMAINQDLKALIIKDDKKLNRNYFFHFLESKAIYIQNEGKGATVKGITLDFLRSIDVPFPPLAEQKRIAEILDKADAIRSKRQQAIQLADDFLKAVFLDMFGDPVTNPNGWDVRPLGGIVDIKGGGTPSKSEKLFWNGDIPWASVKDIKTKYLDKTSDFISAAGVANSATHIIPKGTIITPTRMALGRFVINTIDVAINQDLKALFINKNYAIEQEYLIDFLRLQQAKIESEGKGATVKGVTLDFLKSLKVMIPSIEMQKKYCDIKTRLEITQAKFDITLQQKINFFNAVCHQAFSGQL